MTKPGVSAREVALVGVMAALANVLAVVAIPGPLNIKFGLTAIPILLVSYALGPYWGFLCGILGGVIQAQQYGHLAYVLYTGLQGLAAGACARSLVSTRWIIVPAGFLAGFCFGLWIDLLRTSQFAISTLATSFADAPRVFGSAIDMPIPIIAIVCGLVFALVSFWLKKRLSLEGSVAHLAIAGCIGALAYVPYDAFVLNRLQGYPWIPTWFVLAKDLLQDFLAAFLCAKLIHNPRIRYLMGRS